MALRAAAGRGAEPYDVIIEGLNRRVRAARACRPRRLGEAGATWWVESWWTIERGDAGLAELRRRIEAGPPR